MVFILADDIGYGDFGCYGAVKVKTPNIDRVASQGLRFTDAHSPASVCTPTRYSIMTGQYAFRKKGTGIGGGSTGLLFDPAKLSLASLMKRAGYATAIVGKWHLGLGIEPNNYNGELKPGPLEIGFDYCWIMPSTGDRVPCVWVENHRVHNLDPADPIKINYGVERGAPASYVNGIPRCGSQTGGKSATWDDENISTEIVNKSKAFIEKNHASPFFLYVTTHNIHVPRVPNPQFRGKSETGPRGDVIMELDWTVGQVLDTLDRFKLSDNTLVIISSDNGGELDNNGPTDWAHGIGWPEANKGHRYNGVLRGQKGTVWEGGTRLPLIVRWPGNVRVGTSDDLICLIDLFPSFAALTGQTLAPGEAPDGINLLPQLLGQKTEKPGREYLVEQGNTGVLMALRKGNWKFIPEIDNQERNKKEKPERPEEALKPEKGKTTPPQLFDLSTDLSETKNLYSQRPDIVAEMRAKLEEIKNQK